MGAQVVGLVIGTRKCGTTWLYENFLADPDLAVSRKVKESGFFARADDLDVAYYESLYPDTPGERVEVDSSLAYSDTAPAKILAYNPRMRLVLILRDPVEYAVSRYLHMRRKGQISPAQVLDLVTTDNVLRGELDYTSMLARYDAFRDLGSLLVVPYSLLAFEPVTFYSAVKRHLIGRAGGDLRLVTQRINVSRSSMWTAVTGLLSRTANAARRRKLHGVVNAAKSLGLHRLLESRVDAGELEALRESVAQAIAVSHGASVDLYRRVEGQFAAGPRDLSQASR